IPAAWCGIVGFKPTYGLVPSDGCFPLAPSYDHVGPMASTVAGCVELLQTLAPGFAPTTLESLEELTVGVAWLDDADPLVRARVSEATERFPTRRGIALPLPDAAENKLFMREVADVHRGLFPERADEYGAGVRWKLELCIEVTDAEATAAERLRASYADQCDELLDGVDLLL